MLVQSWFTVYDAGPTLAWHWDNALCLDNIYIQPLAGQGFIWSLQTPEIDPILFYCNNTTGGQLFVLHRVAFVIELTLVLLHTYIYGFKHITTKLCH